MSDDEKNSDRYAGGNVKDTKEQIRKRNEGNKCVNSHCTTLEGQKIGLVVVYQDGTYDKHTVNFGKQPYFTFIDEEKGLIKFKGRVFTLQQHQGENNV